MLLHIVMSFDDFKIVSRNEVTKEEVLKALESTPEGDISYVLEMYNEYEYEDYKTIKYDELVVRLHYAEDESRLFAKYDNR